MPFSVDISEMTPLPQAHYDLSYTPNSIAHNHKIAALLVAAGQLAYVSGATIVRRDDIFDNPTCGIGGRDIFLHHGDLESTVENFARWVEAGAGGLVAADGKFHDKLSYDGESVTLFACDYKSHGAGSVITGSLVRGALGAGGFLDEQCKNDNAGYESSNDLNIGRTTAYPGSQKGDHFC
ncbi:hypothetical protein N7497_009651 [Penicillium chrysogenum]|nr:hypothetical protein N7497_009651 [Penicillium chrysogenum]